MNHAQTHYLLKKLRQVFKDGYRPVRGDEPYGVALDNGTTANNMVNCLGHTFNLRNRQFNDYQIDPAVSRGLDPYFTGFMQEDHADEFIKPADKMLHFIRRTGLKVTPCAPAEPVTDFKSWKIALYFAPGDFHYLLEDAPAQWSGKLGFGTTVEHFAGARPPLKYHDAQAPRSPYFDLCGTYVVTNPHARASNPYVRDRLS